MKHQHRILAVSRFIPRPEVSAGDRRYFAMLELLARSHRVDLYAGYPPKDPAGDRKAISELRSAGVNVLPRDGWGWFPGACRRTRYDLGLFEFWHAADEYGAVLRQEQPWAAAVVDTVDVHFVREEAAARLGLMDCDTVASNRARELKTYRDSEGVIVLTSEDRQALESAQGVRAVFTVPIIVPPRARPSIPRAREVLFIGGFKHTPNVDGLLWFANEIWPLVLARCPSAQLTVVGSSAPREILDLDGKRNTRIAGHVPDTAPYIDRAAVSIAPLRFGGGMKGKVTEALACGIPVVTTTSGAQGFQMKTGVHALVADDPIGFSDAVIQLLSDEAFAERLGTAGRDLEAVQCSPDAAAARLHELVEELTPTSRRPPPSLRWQARSLGLRLGNRALGFVRSGIHSLKT
jgi:glycosyltransferase involved in cell wall biosynthesis